MAPMQTVRFAKVVEQCGKPEAYTLGLPPARDATFQRALREHRVMTLHQETVGTKKDYGLIGFVEGKGKSLLIFPESLEEFEEKRVIAVKYELLEEGEAAGEAPVKPQKQRAKAPEEEKTSPPKSVRSRAEEKPPQPAIREPIRVLPDPPKTKAAAPKTAAPDAGELAKLEKEVRKAMKALEQGKAVAAYQLLEKAMQR
jgi:hypothetical protein